MKPQGFDIIEIVLKKDLQLPLTPVEETELSNMDNEVIEELLKLVNSSIFLEDVTQLTERIIKEAKLLSIDEQEYIKTKCEERIKKLKYPNKTLNSFDINNKKLKKC